MFNNTGGRGRDATLGAGPSSNGKRSMFSVIGQDVTINGSILATADLHIDGKVEGDVDCAALVQGADSRITGNVRAETARITGAIDGKVAVRQLTVESTARITGDVEYESLAMENGATIDGHLRHKSAGTIKLGEPAAPARAETLLLVSEKAG